ncbi:MAG: hypothetical protein JW828_13805, partial [Sedimentisphaerales bacterium]|nr:hypothetical protein [Sedimentisphaerales bacterium]
HAEAKPPAPAEDQELLHRLTKQKLEPAGRREEADSVEPTSPPAGKSTEAAEDSAVRKNVLESLLGGHTGQSGDAGTEMTRPDSSQEDEDAS